MLCPLCYNELEPSAKFYADGTECYFCADCNTDIMAPPLLPCSPSLDDTAIG